MKANDIYRPLRDELKPVLSSLGFSRVRSSPPSYARPGGHGHICLWFKVSSAGWDDALGGKLTGALQSAPEPDPGIEWMTGDFASTRIWRLLDDSARKTAVDIHNSILAKFSHPPDEHWIHTMGSDVVASALDDLKPLASPPARDSDFWFRYLDVDDVGRWARFFAEALPEFLHQFELELN